MNKFDPEPISYDVYYFFRFNGNRRWKTVTIIFAGYLPNIYGQTTRASVYKAPSPINVNTSILCINSFFLSLSFLRE